jgi:hypothetical protein
MHARKNASLDKGGKLAEVIAIKTVAAFQNGAAAFSQTIDRLDSESPSAKTIYGEAFT